MVIFTNTLHQNKLSFGIKKCIASMYKAQTDLLMFTTCILLLIVLISNVKKSSLVFCFFLSYYFVLFFGFDNVTVIAV